MEKRPTAQDYKKEMQDLLNKTEKLRLIVITRLYTLCANHPQATVITPLYGGVKAKTLLGSNRSKDIIETLEFETQIRFIGQIEKWVAEQNPVKQLTIDYDPKTICNCDKRDMPVYEEDGKRWCPQCGLEVR